MRGQIDDAQLVAYLAGELAWWRRWRIRRKILTDPQVRQRYQQLEAVWWQLDEWTVPPPSRNMQDHFHRVFREEFGTTSLPCPRPTRRATWGPAWGWALTAAAMLTLIALYQRQNAYQPVSRPLPVAQVSPAAPPVSQPQLQPQPQPSPQTEVSRPSVQLAQLPSPSPATPGIIRMGEVPLRHYHRVREAPVPFRSPGDDVHTVGLRGAPGGWHPPEVYPPRQPVAP